MTQPINLPRYSLEIDRLPEGTRWKLVPDMNGGVVMYEEARAAIEADRAARVEAKPKLLDWRTDDYLQETSDPAMAKNWEPHYKMLPIFEGDPHTKLAAPAPHPPSQATVAEMEADRNAPNSPS